MNKARRDRSVYAKAYLKTPYARIWLAANSGKGVRLSPDDVLQLSKDEAIMKVGERDVGVGRGEIDDPDETI